MIVIGLDDKFYKNWPPNGHGTAKESKKKKSNLHKKVKSFLEKSFPADIILQEVELFGTEPWPLRLDFYLPVRNLAVEAHGRQHYEFVRHFHKNPLEFRKSQIRDQNKRSWCSKNNIDLLELPYHGTTEYWEQCLRKITGNREGS